MTKPCIICGEPIPEARLEIGGRNWIKTCSTKCRDENVRRVRTETVRRWRAKQKAKRGGVDKRRGIPAVPDTAPQHWRKQCALSLAVRGSKIKNGRRER